MQKLHKETYLKAIDTFVKSEHYNIFPILDIPVLVLVGELDNLTPVSMAKEICSKIDGSIFKIIPGTLAICLTSKILMNLILRITFS